MTFASISHSARVVGQLREHFAHFAGYALMLLAPFSLFWPIAEPATQLTIEIFVTPGLYLSDLACAAVIVAGLLSRQRRWGMPAITIPLLLLAGLAGATAMAALQPRLAVYASIRWLIAVGVYLALLQQQLPIRRLVIVFLAGLGVQALVALGQVLAQGPLGLPGELALERERSGTAIIALGHTRWLRAYGLTFHPNVLGGYLVAGLLVGLPLLAAVRFRLLWLLLWLGLLLSFSRSAWLGLAIVLPPLGAWLAWRQRDLRRPLALTLAGAALIALVVGVLLANQISVRFSPAAVPAEGRSISERAVLLVVALESIASRPLTGVGAGNFPLIVEAFRAPITPQPVHNVALLLAAEVGVAGGLLWLWLWVAPVLALDGRWRQIDAWPVALAGAWTALGIIALWDDYPWGLETGRLLATALLSMSSRALVLPDRPAHPAQGHEADDSG